MSRFSQVKELFERRGFQEVEYPGDHVRRFDDQDFQGHNLAIAFKQLGTTEHLIITPSSDPNVKLDMANLIRVLNKEGIERTIPFAEVLDFFEREGDRILNALLPENYANTKADYQRLHAQWLKHMAILYAPKPRILYEGVGRQMRELYSSDKMEGPVDKYFGSTIDESVEKTPNELEIDEVGLWQVIPRGRDSFGLDGNDLIDFTRRHIIALVEWGGVPVIALKHQPQYGVTAEEIAENIIAEWLESGGGDPDVGGIWFATPDRVDW